MDLRSLVTIPALGAVTGVLSPVVSALTLYDEMAADPAIYLWASSMLRTAGVHTAAAGLENLPAGNFVLAVNHQSHFDALVLFRHIRRHMRFVAKKELARIPIFGYALRRAGNVFVDRSGGPRDKSKLNDAVERVRNSDTSIVFFAEGTRSEDGVLRPFKKGAAIFAIDAQVPLVPAALAGTHEILPKGTLAVRPRPAALVVGEAIDTTGKTHDDREALTEQAHASVTKLLTQAQAMLPGL
jgi:1-acyl-sn-glycerol-3-phosphate acyltransferase